MEDMGNGFPTGLFKAFAEKKITRARFEFAFAEWQKRQGVNFDCKGTGDGVYVHYRGVKAEIRNGMLVWCAGVKPAGKYIRRLDWKSAGSIFEFKRMVDFDILLEYLWKGGGRCRELTR